MTDRTGHLLRHIHSEMLRDLWLKSEELRTEMYKKFMDANKSAPYRAEYDTADTAAKRAKEAYSKALQSNGENT